MARPCSPDDDADEIVAGNAPLPCAEMVAGMDECGRAAYRLCIGDGDADVLTAEHGADASVAAAAAEREDGGMSGELCVSATPLLLLWTVCCAGAMNGEGAGPEEEDAGAGCAGNASAEPPCDAFRDSGKDATAATFPAHADDADVEPEADVDDPATTAGAGAGSGLGTDNGCGIGVALSTFFKSCISNLCTDWAVGLLCACVCQQDIMTVLY